MNEVLVLTERGFVNTVDGPIDQEINMHRESLQNAARRAVPTELLFPDVDAGYQTVWQFLYEREPWVLVDLEDECGGAVRRLLEDDARARRVALREREPVITIDGPEQLQRLGHPRVGCYTKSVLMETFR